MLAQVTAFAMILLVAFLLLTVAGLYTFRYARMPASLDFIDRIAGTMLGLVMACLFLGMLGVIFQAAVLWARFRCRPADHLIVPSSVRGSFLVGFFSNRMLPLIFAAVHDRFCHATRPILFLRFNKMTYRSANDRDPAEFPKILEQLARHSSFSASRDLVMALRPCSDAYEVRAQLRLTGEARRLLDDRPEVSVGGARDVRASLRRARRGGVLEAPAFLEIADTLASARRLRVTLLRLEEPVFPRLRELAQDLPNPADDRG